MVKLDLQRQRSARFLFVFGFSHTYKNSDTYFKIIILPSYESVGILQTPLFTTVIPSVGEIALKSSRLI